METSDGEEALQGWSDVTMFSEFTPQYVVRGWSEMALRPPLSKKLFPVGRVGKKTASREVGIFSPLISIFLKQECTGGKVAKKNFFEKMKKKVPVGP